MAFSVKLKDVLLIQLNAECLLLVSRFARALKRLDGKVIHMQDSDVLVEISKHAKQTEHDELKEMYIELKGKIGESVHQSMQD